MLDSRSSNFDKWFRSQTRFPKLVREDVKTRTNFGDECTTNEREKSFCDVENKFTGIQDLLAEDSFLRTTESQFCFKGFFLVFCGCGCTVRVQETWPQFVH